MRLPVLNHQKPFGIIVQDTILLFQQASQTITVGESTDGENFSKTKKRFSYITGEGKKRVFDHAIFARQNDAYMGMFGGKNSIFFATSSDALRWTEQSLLSKTKTAPAIVSDYQYKNQTVAYWASDTIHIGFSKDRKNWELFDDPLFDSQLTEGQSLMLLSSFTSAKEIFVPFAIRTPVGDHAIYSLSVAIFQKDDPRKIAWRLQYPFWMEPEQMIDKAIIPLGLIVWKEKIQSYWYTPGGNILSVVHALLRELVSEPGMVKKTMLLKKSDRNPILRPDTNNSWESQAVFNPAAIYYDEKVHLLYRAVGESWVSVFGYAASTDGIHVDERDTLPAYVPRAAFEGKQGKFDPSSPFTSGPGYGGCEDPRLTKINKRIYLTYVAYNGMTGPRVALSSIDASDFSEKKWDNWSEPVLISQPNVIDKNACIFPEKIQGKYAVMHRVFPNILIDFVDSLDFDGTSLLKGEYRIAPRTRGWDSRKVGAGPPPIKTPYGWLLLYHAVDDKDDGKYHIGAMILDLNDPTIVLHRSLHPIISPTHWYENMGFKAGVVYPCGAITKNDLLHLYYGGADTYVCVATAPLTDFLQQLTYHNTIQMQSLVFS